MVFLLFFNVFFFFLHAFNAKFKAKPLFVPYLIYVRLCVCVSVSVSVSVSVRMCARTLCGRVCGRHVIIENCQINQRGLSGCESISKWDTKFKLSCSTVPFCTPPLSTVSKWRSIYEISICFACESCHRSRSSRATWSEEQLSISTL